MSSHVPALPDPAAAPAATWPPRTAFARRRRALGVRRTHLLLPIVRWSFYLFVFSIPLEYPQRSIPLEVHTITASLFLLAASLQPRLCFRKPPAAFLWLTAFLWIYAALNLLSPHAADGWKLFFNYLLCAFVLWTASNVLRFESVARKAFVGFIIGAAIIGVLQRLDIATTVAGGRSTVFGQDANFMGGNMAIGAVLVLGLAFGRTRVPLGVRALAGISGLLLLRTLLWSGSRGAGLAVAMGVITFAFRSGNFRQVAKHVGIAVLAGVVLVAAAYRNHSLLNRYQSTVSGGDLSGREQIYPQAMKMVAERPLFGWGPGEHLWELGRRTSGFEIGARNADGVAVHVTRDTHDVPLDILTGVGLVGGIPFFVAIGLGLLSAWRVRAGPRGTLPLAMMICALALGMSLNIAPSKQLWLIVAYAISSVGGIPRPQIVVRRRPRRFVAAA